MYGHPRRHKRKSFILDESPFYSIGSESAVPLPGRSPPFRPRVRTGTPVRFRPTVLSPRHSVPGPQTTASSRGSTPSQVPLLHQAPRNDSFLLEYPTPRVESFPPNTTPLPPGSPSGTSTFPDPLHRPTPPPVSPPIDWGLTPVNRWLDRPSVSTPRPDVSWRTGPCSYDPPPYPFLCP